MFAPLTFLHHLASYHCRPVILSSDLLIFMEYLFSFLIYLLLSDPFSRFFVSISLFSFFIFSETASSAFATPCDNLYNPGSWRLATKSYE